MTRRSAAILRLMPRLRRAAARVAPGPGEGGGDASDPPCRLCKNEGVVKYAVVVHAEPEGGFWAEVPALPGCYSQGETIAELMENLREAITGVMEVLRERGGQPETGVQILDIAV